MKIILLIIFFIPVFVNANELTKNPQIANRIEHNKQILCVDKLKCKSPLLPKFYANRKYSLAWIKNGELTSSGTDLVAAIENSYMDGLDPRIYHIRQINKMVAKLQNGDGANNPDLVANLDLTLTDGLLLYINNLVYGWQDSKKLYPDWPIAQKKIDLLSAADKMASSGKINEVLQDISPKYPGYQKLREKLADYYSVAANDNGWDSIPSGDVLQNGANGGRVKMLQDRLYISGELSSIDHPGVFDNDVEKAVTLYQENNGIDDDGTVGPQTLRSLNVSVTNRIRQIELNMDRMRFLPDSYPARYAVVNVPDYSLETFEDGKQKLLSPVVVGKPTKKTCILNSQITTVEINPFWNVPYGIASKELLPEIKSNPKYLADNNIKVFQVSNGKSSEIDPKTINWKKVESGNFNFRFRQNPGDDNALGKLKFMFQNNCSIYLHDSPFPELFDETQRGFSHGCVRVGKPTDFANFLLAPNKGWSEKSLDTEITSGKQKFVKIAKPLQLYIIYITAWYDPDVDFVQFRDDIYNFDKLSLYPVYISPKNVKQVQPASSPVTN